jgi:hypothetical protein
VGLEMNIYAPSKYDLLYESEEGNCTEHYAFLRNWYEAKWGAILFAYSLYKSYHVNLGQMVWEEFDNETQNIPCHK